MKENLFSNLSWYALNLTPQKLDVVEIIEREKERITNDPELRHLVEKKGE
ncbi:hypothetical protein [Capnocytophaga gingivalis]|uniref:Uncharacterized protein n=1 Tax=Capnocytophaga gingivalis TaxID=1017 RepID=A0ABU5YCJ1_9FLAO|nr:hypothetical protein [Capnocytophaga gingivalis]MEB3041486.1 hypothetical protein [Capnocytophaga gingivalis]